MLLKRLCDFKLVKCRDTFADLKMDPNADKFRLTKPLGSEKTVSKNFAPNAKKYRKFRKLNID